MMPKPAPLRFILALYLLLGTLYSIATPIFEASDEVSHYGVIQHIVDTGQLPVQRVGVRTPWEQEGSQPPLYYLLMSVVVRTLDTSDYVQISQRNPHAQPGDPSLDANRNLVIHSSAEDFPWRGTALAVHLLRFLSLGLGAMTIMFGYALAQRIFPDRPTIPIGTAALIAFNPMFVFIAASVNNDNLVIALTSAALYLTVVIYQENRLDRAAWLRRIALGVVLGAATLTKISGLTLLPIIGLILTIRHLRRREWGAWLITGTLLIVLVAASAGWWYLRNLSLYGEVLGLDTMVAIAGPRTMTLSDLVSEFDGFRYSYWALFGAVNILTWPVAYAVWDAFTLIALIGCGVWLGRSRPARGQRVLVALLALYVLFVFIGVIRWSMMTPASQGRLMFAAIGPISLLLWLGWERVVEVGSWRLEVGGWKARVRSGVKWAMLAFMLGVAAISPSAYIAPVYAGPMMLTPDQVPATITRIDADFGSDLRLLGYIAPARAAADLTAEFTLYWQCLRQPEADLSVFVIVYGRNLREIGKRDAYPYRGLYGTRQCAAGQVFADPYHVRLQADALRPTVLRVQIGLKDRTRDVELTPTINGQAVSSVIVTAGSLPPDQMMATPAVTARYRLGDAIELLGYEVETSANEVRYRLYWKALTDGVEDFTLFAHLLDANGAQIGQGDSQPFNGDYPTSVWRAGEIFVEERSLVLETSVMPKKATLAVGLYRLSDGTRLPVIDMTGQRLRDDQIVLSVK